MTHKTHTTHSDDETRKLAGEFASKLKGGEIVELIGDLGSGKTTFVRGVAEALGSTARVKSPTFTIMNEYPTKHKSIKKIVHIDLYRFSDASQLDALEIDDYQKSDTVIFVEWPEVVEKLPVKSTHKIKLDFVDETTRKIKF
ncbi:MAG: tRNA (adenosine(37)-N6)-threonylcarbamoyltransferase complex ATPase subunit type 1 TsaE [bacterium]